MKLIFVLAALVAVALAKPQHSSKDAQILRYESDNIDDSEIWGEPVHLIPILRPRYKSNSRWYGQHSCTTVQVYHNTSNMKTIFVLAALVAVALARPQHPSKDAQILSIKAEAHTVLNHSCLFSSEITYTRVSTNPPSNMKAIFVLAAIVAVAVARPQDPKDAQILRYESDNIGNGHEIVTEPPNVILTFHIASYRIWDPLTMAKQTN
ncbi:hypothetical protein CBL_06314 [Carabus blaptoides fortunei]